MKTEKTIKAIKAMKRLKKYCSKHELCKDCVFYCESPRYTDCCMIRNKNPEEYDIEINIKGAYLNDTQKGT